jgi:SRSO17 transposase
MTRVRKSAPTVAFVDQYCAQYRPLFANVRHFEQFTQLHLGLLAETKRKSLPRLAKTAQGEHQALHHFLANAEWSVEEVRSRRLELLRKAVGDQAIIVCLDETGDRKKGKTTDYTAPQYIGNLHGTANGVVSVNAYGVLGTTTFPLTFRFFKPKSRLKEGEVYKSKPLLAVKLLEELCRRGFHLSVVLADSMYGESGDVTRALDRLKLPYVVAIRSNHPVWTFPGFSGERKRYTRWRAYERTFADGSSEQRFLREIVFGRRTPTRYYQLTTDPVRQPEETTWYLKTNLAGKIERSVGNTFGLRTWIEYGFKQAKDELGWADYRLTDAQSIERWWELVMSAYTLVSLQSLALLASAAIQQSPPAASLASVTAHPLWAGDAGWKHQLNNLRLLLQPYVCAALLLPWLRLFDLPHLERGLADACSLMNAFHRFGPT